MIETKYKDIYIEGTEIYKKTKTGEFHKLCQWVDNVGYYQVSFKLSGKRKYIRVHRLIAETLIPNPDNLTQVNHKDGNKLNNLIDNLEWVSNSANTQHGYDNGLYHSSKRSHKIKTIHKATGEEQIFDSIRSCSEKLNLNRKTITAILKDQKANNYDFFFQYL